MCDVAREADRGLAMINHLLSFARMEQREAVPLDIHGLASRILELRSEEPAGQASSSRTTFRLSPWLFSPMKASSKKLF